MKILAMTVVMALASLPAGAAFAKDNKGKDGGRHVELKHSGKHIAATRGCPPGLAKKKNGCRPPGQVNKAPIRQTTNDDVVIRKTGTTTTTSASRNGTITTRTVEYVTAENGERFRVGDQSDTGYRDRFRVINNPELFDLAPVGKNRSYVRVGDTAMLVDDDTREVLNLFALANVLID